jgi:NhaA family Na+:H+ antiporter
VTIPAAPEPIDWLLSPFRRFAHVEAAGGVLLLVATAVALGLANSPYASAYEALWETPVGVTLGQWRSITDLHHIVNDGLMAVFFFVVGLEIKRALIAGELASARRAALPMLGALGGMLAPAIIYLIVTGGGAAARGWGIPTATDIAFALGILALLGDRVPGGLKMFLAALAIVDDIGAIVVIAVFYSQGVSWTALAGAALVLLAAAGANRAGVRRPLIYGLLGVALWAAVHASGVHATIAGVLLAATIPVRTRLDEASFLTRAQAALEDFDDAARVTAEDPTTTVLSNAGHHDALERLETLTEQAQPPLVRMEHMLHGLVAFGIMPLFALANAGVALGGGAGDGVASASVVPAVALGLVLGKPIGITAFAWLGVRAGLAALPAGVTWPMISGVGLLGGVGFTMALFIAGLAFADPAMVAQAKVGILAGSATAAVAGGWVLRRGLPAPRSYAGEAQDGSASTGGPSGPADRP